ncbi:hypothetical protein Hamer_G000055 [Homarus americanus]|uniref:Uncharacterized protein n=1 Tax=Homarus americanus TaxID=6706 RepID=A0A8J5NCR9_HOMAM|nr:hypothetical protein Hamer_G000055 [Homarus americanus]
MQEAAYQKAKSSTYNDIDTSPGTDAATPFIAMANRFYSLPVEGREGLQWGWAFLSCPRVERGVCGFVATDNPDVDPSGGPTPELTPGDGSPYGGSIEVTPMPGVPAASHYFSWGLITRYFQKSISWHL